MKRREFITLLGGAVAAWPLAARAQQSTGQPLVGLLSPLSAAAWVHILGAFRRGMRDLGYVEGANVVFTFRFADGQVATASLARPGGNVTGFWAEGDEALIGKQLDLLKHAVPGIARVGVMVNPDDTADAQSLKALPAAARALGLTVRILDVRAAAEFEPALAAAVREGLQGLHVSQSPLFYANRTQVTAIAARAGLPAIYGFREFAMAGGLISYAASLPDIWRRIAGVVDKILKGANPGDLPIERPTQFELVVNLKTAKSMGLTIPEPFLLLADEVIE